MMSSPLRVLIVEDNAYDTRLVVAALHEAGYVPQWSQVQTEEAYLAALKPDLDIVLADYSMPQFSAIRALELLRQSGLQIPLIIVSGSVGEDLAVEAMRLGADDYLLKDRLGRLSRAIQTALERRRLRQAHQQAQNEAIEWRVRYEAAVLASGQVLYDWDPRTDEIVFGGDFERVLGYTSAELAGGLARWMELIHPEDLGEFQRLVKWVKETGLPFYQQYRLRRKDGVMIHIEDRGHFTRDAADRPARMVGFVVDVTDRRRAERELADSRRMLQMVLNTIPIGVFWKDRQSRYLGCNRMVSEAFGLTTPEAIVGLSDYELPHLLREQADFFVATDREVMNRGVGKAGIVEPATFANGRTAWLETSKIPMYDAIGRVSGVLGVWQDVTERRRMEDALRQSQKMEAIGQLAGGVAHDFNNLLTVINGYGEVLLSQLEPNSPHYPLMEQVRRAGQRAAGLTRQLLAFSRKTVLVPVVVDLNSLLTDSEKLLRPLIGEEVDLVFRPHFPLWRVKVDPGEIDQVVMNLAINARDAMPTGGKLTIETANVCLDARYTETRPEARVGEFVLLAISDTGHGMDAAIRKRIFEPFFTTKGQKGTGLGLATAYGIIKQSGGHIEVYSEPGLGTTFKIYLPRELDSETLTRSSQAVRKPAMIGGTETLILAEDEEGVRRLAKLVLEQAGYTVHDAADGAAALALAAKHHQTVRLLVTDVVMPNMSGPQLAENMLQVVSNLKVLYLSGYTDDAVVRHGILEGESHFLQKPFTPLTLLAKVHEVLHS